MKLPNVHRAQIEQGKITDYLLSLVNPRSGAKADFFLSFGFSRDRWEEFAKALKAHAASYEVARVVETAYGPRYYVDGALETPDECISQIHYSVPAQEVRSVQGT